MSRHRLTQLASAAKDAETDHVMPWPPLTRLKPGEKAHADEKGRPISRSAFHVEQHAIRRFGKREATRTRSQRSNEMSIMQRLLRWDRLDPSEKERRIRRLPREGKVLVATKQPSILQPFKSFLRLGREKKAAGGANPELTRRRSGLYVPTRRSA